MNESTKDNRHIYETEIIFNNGLQGELIRTTFGSGGYRVGLEHITDPNLELQILYGNKWVEYEMYMKAIGENYKKPINTNNGVQYPVNYESITETTHVQRIPFDIEAVYGELTPGKYRVIKEINYETGNGEEYIDYIAGVFSITE